MTAPIAFAEARAIVDRIARGQPLPSEAVTLSRSHGRVLAADLVAGIAQPPFDNAAMDGFAVRFASGDVTGEASRFTLVGEQFAGGPGPDRLAPGTCLRITTGAPVPPDADAVVMKEHVRLQGDVVQVDVLPAPGQFIRRRGVDTAPGDRLLRAGDMLGPAQVSVAAAQGRAGLDVARRPTVAVFTTGDELVEPGMPLLHGQVYNANRELLMGLLRADGLEPVAWPTLPDDPAQVESAFRHAGHAFDVVLTIGGVSAGEKDFIPSLMHGQGEVHFWKVRMRPGMPVLFAGGGRLGSALFLCLPGNPVSVLASYLALGRVLLDGLQGRANARPVLRARMATGWSKTHERLEFLRGRLEPGQDGTLWVTPNPADGSHRIRAAAESDVLLVLEERAGDRERGEAVDVIPY
ncbi:MAG TPA: gephyrin-like molybdotransferase Glp [Luteimonas sp.]|nr:gephyrin-like molybdotransferase Glp [Luteimonas sp.]